MIIRNENCWIISREANTDYWGQEASPSWTAIGSFIYHPGQRRGAGAEPHYHDGDEIWIFRVGRGQAWINDEPYEVIPNTAVYTPMGNTHRFQMFTDFDNASVVTRLEGRGRDDHLYPETDGVPEPMAPGLVVPGDRNLGPIRERGSRCPFSELRTVQLEAGEGVGTGKLAVNEHWAVASGSLRLAVDGLEAELGPGDVAMMRAGTERELASPIGASLFLARE